MSYSVLEIAEKIIAKIENNQEAGELVSNLKLQKLLYYLQGFFLAYFGKPLFDDEIEAWMYGPVVPVVYEKYKDFKNSGISISGKETILLNEKEEALFNEVLNIYGVFSAIGLMEFTQNEIPWKTTETGINCVISKGKLMKFFRRKLK